VCTLIYSAAASAAGSAAASASFVDPWNFPGGHEVHVVEDEDDLYLPGEQQIP